jgi:hypothetical protein
VSSEPYLLDAREHLLLIVDWFQRGTGGWPDGDDLARMLEGVQSISEASLWGAVSEELLAQALRGVEDQTLRQEVYEWAAELHGALMYASHNDESEMLSALLSTPPLLDRAMQRLIARGVERPLRRIVGGRLFEAARVLCQTSRDLFILGQGGSELFEELHRATPEVFLGYEGWLQKASVVAKISGVPQDATRAWLDGLPPQVVCEGLGLLDENEQEIFYRLCEHDDVRLWGLADAVRAQVAGTSTPLHT